MSDLNIQEKLVPCPGIVTVSTQDRRIARSSRAMLTARVEANAEILLPIEDAGDTAALWRRRIVGADGRALVAFDPDRVRITIEDRWPDGRATVSRFPRWGDMRELAALMDVAPAGEALFVAPTYGDIRRNVVEGGQLLGASIVAAARSAPDKRVVSAHIILSRPAVFDAAIDFAVASHRLGRSFATLGVEATQHGKPVSSTLVLLDRGAPDVIRSQVAMPAVPGPDEAEFFDFGVVGRESRFVGGDYDPDPDRIGPSELHCWVRHREAPDDLCLRQALLVQSMSHFTIAAAMLPHQGFGEAIAHHSLSTGVLTVTVALHEDPDITGWLLYTNPAIYAGRGLAQGEGRVFAQDGRLIASYSAQVMIRDFDRSQPATGLDSTRIM